MLMKVIIIKNIRKQEKDFYRKKHRTRSGDDKH